MPLPLLGRSVALVACLLPLVACGGAGGSATADPPLGGDQQHSLVVEQTYGPGRGGVLLVEGGIADVLVRGEGGKEEVLQGNPDKPLTFKGLAAGQYTVEPAIRPCNANCGNLGGRIYGCSISIDVPAVTRLAVRYIATEPCEVEQR